MCSPAGPPPHLPLLFTNLLEMDDIEIIDTIMKLEQELAEVEDFIQKMEIKDEILELRRKAGLIKPPESPYECEGCSA